MLEISPYSGKDIVKCFEIWNEAHSDGITGIKRFLTCTVMDVNFRSTDIIMAYDGDKPAGFVYAPHRIYSVKNTGEREKTGYITLLSVAKGYNVRETGGILLDAAEEYHKKQGMTSLSTGYSPIYINQGYTVSETEYTDLFESRGYGYYESAKRVLNLSEMKEPEGLSETAKKLKGEGIYTGPLKEDLIASFLDESNPFIGSGWSKEFRMRLEHGHDYNAVRVAALGSRVIGACIFGDPFSNGERFGPFGVDENFRLKGIGTVLLNGILKEMKARNLKTAWMQWTPVKGPASHIYDRTGFRVTDIYRTYSKEI